MGKDMLLNLAGEAIGILVTVLVIDQWVKRRERKRWQPARDLIYVRMVKICDQVFRAALPEGLRSKTLELVSFGKAVEIRRRRLPASGSTGSADWDAVLDEIDLQAQLGQFPDFEMLMESDRQIDQLIDGSAFVLDPEPLHLLYSLSREFRLVHGTLGFRQGEAARKAEEDPDRVGIVIAVLIAASALCDWLDRKADRRRGLTLAELLGGAIADDGAAESRKHVLGRVGGRLQARWVAVQSTVASLLRKPTR